MCALDKFLRIRKINPRGIGAISIDYWFQTIVATANPDTEGVDVAVSDPDPAVRLSSSGIVVV
jgi:hypothetical protein